MVVYRIINLDQPFTSWQASRTSLANTLATSNNGILGSTAGCYMLLANG